MPLKLKICLLGATGVGKTSLVGRYVRRVFSEKYLTTVGVTIDKMLVRDREVEVELIIWDLSGDDEFQNVQLAYLRGAAGYLLVVDGTRRETLPTSLALHARAVQLIGTIPFMLVFNKADEAVRWEIGKLEDGVPGVAHALGDLCDLEVERSTIALTSAKTGAGVEDAFGELVARMMRAREARRGSR